MCHSLGCRIRICHSLDCRIGISHSIGWKIWITLSLCWILGKRMKWFSVGHFEKLFILFLLFVSPPPPLHLLHWFICCFSCHHPFSLCWSRSLWVCHQQWPFWLPWQRLSFSCALPASPASALRWEILWCAGCLGFKIAVVEKKRLESLLYACYHLASLSSCSVIQSYLLIEEFTAVEIKSLCFFLVRMDRIVYYWRSYKCTVTSLYQ